MSKRRVEREMVTCTFKGAVTCKDSYNALAPYHFKEPAKDGSDIVLQITDPDGTGEYDSWHPVILLAMRKYGRVKRLHIKSKRRPEDLYALCQATGMHIEHLTIEYCNWELEAAECLSGLFPNLKWLVIIGTQCQYLPALLNVHKLKGLFLEVVPESGNAEINCTPSKGDDIITELPFVYHVVHAKTLVRLLGLLANTLVVDIATDDAKPEMAIRQVQTVLVVYAGFIQSSFAEHVYIKDRTNTAFAITEELMRKFQSMAIAPVGDATSDITAIVPAAKDEKKISDTLRLVTKSNDVDAIMKEFSVGVGFDARYKTPAVVNAKPSLRAYLQSNATIMDLKTENRSLVSDYAFDVFPSLTNLTVRIGGNQWMPILYRSPALKKVMLNASEPYDYQTPPEPSTATHVAFMSQELTLFGKEAGDVTLRLIPYLLKNATSLALYNSFLTISDQDAFSFYGFGTGLKALSLVLNIADSSGCAILNLIPTMYACTSLEIELVQSALTQVQIDGIASMRQLTSLKLVTNKFNPNYNRLARLTRLQTLALITQDLADDGVISQLLANLPVLQTISFRTSSQPRERQILSTLFKSIVPIGTYQFEKPVRRNPQVQSKLVYFSRMPKDIFQSANVNSGRRMHSNSWYAHRHVPNARAVLSLTVNDNQETLQWKALQSTEEKHYTVSEAINTLFKKVFNLDVIEQRLDRHEYMMSCRHNVHHVVRVAERGDYVLTAVLGSFDVKLTEPGGIEPILKTILEGQYICCSAKLATVQLYLHPRSAPDDQVVVLKTRYPQYVRKGQDNLATIALKKVPDS